MLLASDSGTPLTSWQAWYDGVHGWEVENGALKVHLKGQLWPGFTEAQTFAVRELLCGILGTLDELGYELVASMDFTAVPAWNRLGAAQPGRSRGSTNSECVPDMHVRGAAKNSGQPPSLPPELQTE